MRNLPAIVKSMCEKHNIRLNTDLGQHFLIDEVILRDILRSANILPGERVYEAGAGMGILTLELLRCGAFVTSAEIDTKWIPVLKEFVAGQEGFPSRLNLVHGDALEVPLPQAPYKVVSNIPYQITSPLLRRFFLQSDTPPVTLTLLMQYEVARRICDQREGNLLGIMVQLFGMPRLMRKVMPGSFLPPPGVDSAILHIITHRIPLADNDALEAVLEMSKVAFSQKRKMLRNTVGTMEYGMDFLLEAQIDPMRRPETLTIDEWVTLGKAATGGL